MTKPSYQPRLRHLKWLPNALTLSRSVLVLFALGAALQERWEVALWLFLAALATDFLDGLAAKKLNAQSEFGEQFDAWSDSCAVIAGLVSLSLTGHISWWITVGVLTAGLLVGSDRFFKQPFWRWRAMLAVSCLFIAWIGIVWFYAYLAYGWSWLYVVLTLLILVGCGVLKRHRIRAWLA